MLVEPRRLVLIRHLCDYCQSTEDVFAWNICHLFGILHCPEHADRAQADCEAFMKREHMVRLADARRHSVLGPFLADLGDTIPVLRSSGFVDTEWYFHPLSELPHIRRSMTTGQWGFNLTCGEVSKFVPLRQFLEPRVALYLTPGVVEQIEDVVTVLEMGIY